MSITVTVLASGSRGNSTFVRTARTRLLIDCGLSRRAIGKRLAAIGENVDDLNAVLVTHEHTDHAGGLAQLVKEGSIEAYMSCGTIDGTRADSFDMNGSAIVPVVPGRAFQVGDIEVNAFPVPHDAEEPIAFTLRHEGAKIAQLTDLGWIPDHVVEAISGSDVLILESNHDLDMLRMGPYPWNLKERLMGRHGHLSNTAVGRYLAGPYDGRAQHVVLAHLSSKNNHPEIARLEAAQALSSRGFDDASLTLAAQDSPGAPIRVG